MPTYRPPFCLRCKNLKSQPKAIGEKASCSKYAKIPDKIYFEGGNCQYFTDKLTAKSPKGSKRKV